MSKSPVPAATSETARRTMLANKRRDTRPELAVRKLIHKAGLRYRVDSLTAPGIRSRADIVFPRARVAVFIDGCFWHSCPDHFVQPKSNVDYWRPKLARNVARDREADRQLAEAGWQVLRYWEHESASAVALDVIAQIQARTANR